MLPLLLLLLLAVATLVLLRLLLMLLLAIATLVLLRLLLFLVPAWLFCLASHAPDTHTHTHLLLESQRYETYTMKTALT